MTRRTSLIWTVWITSGKAWNAFHASVYLIHVATDKMCCVFLDSDFVTSWNLYVIFSRELALDPNGGIPMKE